MGGSVSASGSSEPASKKKSCRPPGPSSSQDLLSDVERKIVLETWQFLSFRMEETGIQFFLRFFELEPEAKNAFPFRDLEENQLTKNILFRSHATRFMRAVEAVTTNIDVLELTVIPNLVSLGRKHASIGGFRVKYLATFERAMIDVCTDVLGQKFNRTAKRAWTKIFRFVADRLSEGVRELKPQAT